MEKRNAVYRDFSDANASRIGISLMRNPARHFYSDDEVDGFANKKVFGMAVLFPYEG